MSLFSIYARRAITPFHLIKLNCENNLRENILLRSMFIESEETILMRHQKKLCCSSFRLLIMFCIAIDKDDSLKCEYNSI